MFRLIYNSWGPDYGDINLVWVKKYFDEFLNMYEILDRAPIVPKPSDPCNIKFPEPQVHSVKLPEPLDLIESCTCKPSDKKTPVAFDDFGIMSGN